ncbi:flagellar hook-basal body complex protein [Chitinimonas sp.]|uniref:flagellar hook-basal body complex protein n=1 Tax=Chitinimonas sp. TaxID=1934313 RepID=UPI0035B40DD5
MSFQQGLSGLDSSSKFLDVIGNNVANANTVGFKGARAEFSDIYANTLASTGLQVGIGGRTSGVAQQFSQGNLSNSENPLDMAIQGNGFFQVVDKNGSVSYTRNGQFQLDRDGYIVNNGQRLAGYITDANGQIVQGGGTNPGGTTAIKVQAASIGGRATGSSVNSAAGLQLGVNLDSRALVTSRGTTALSINGLKFDPTAGSAAPTISPNPIRVADSTGAYHTLQLQLVHTAPQQWQLQTALDDTAVPSGNFKTAATLSFDAKTGALTSPSPTKVIMSPSGAPPFEVSVNFGNAVEDRATPPTTVNGTLTENNAAKPTTVSISGANLSPATPAGALPPYTVKFFKPDGTSSDLTVTLTAVGPGTNTWTATITDAGGGTFTPATLDPLVFIDSTTGLVKSGGLQQLTLATTSGGNPVNLTVNLDLSTITQITGAGAAGTAVARSTTAVSTTDSNTFTSSTSATVYDSQGNPHTETYFFTKVAPNTWEIQTSFDGAKPVIQPNFLTFNTDGTLNSGGTFALNNQIPPPNGATSPLSFNTMLKGSTQFGSGFSVNSLSQDGYAPGNITGLSISGNGLIQGRYSNGQNQNIGQIVLFNFANSQGLQSVGSNRWVETFASNQARAGVPGSSDFGSLQSGALENSNVDLTKELVDMITAQRSYQANAQTIKTQDQVLQTLVNLR